MIKAHGVSEANNLTQIIRSLEVYIHCIKRTESGMSQVQADIYAKLLTEPLLFSFPCTSNKNKFAARTSSA